MEIEILTESRLRYWCGRIDVPCEATDELVQVAGRIASDGRLYEIFAAEYERVVVRKEYIREWRLLEHDPAVEAILGEQASLFYLIAYLGTLPNVEQEYLRRGIGMDVFHDTMLDFPIYINDYYYVHNRWGYDEFMWIWRHLECELFRLGRLQFALAEFEGHVTGFRNRKTGQYLLLADPTLPLRADGNAVGAGKLRWKPIVEEENSAAVEAEKASQWLPAYEQVENGWKGHPVSQRGIVAREPILLGREEWDLVLQHGDTVLDIHIPRKDPFNIDNCRESLQQAFDFFPRYLPEKPFRAGYCHTWFFTSQLHSLLPAESNILAFQNEFYLYPYAGGPDFLWAFVFGEKYPDPASAPRDTSLRRAVLDWLAAGNELFDLPGVFFHGPEEWGSHPYSMNEA
jgi:hypothetical protein